MKIAFVVTSTYGCERIGVQTLVALAKEQGHGAFFYALDTLPEEEIASRLEAVKPDVIAYSAMTYEHNKIHAFNRKLKEKFSFISIFGGPHYTFNPEEIDRNEYIDAVCVGEGENAFRSFLKHVENKTDYTHVPNLSVRLNSTIYKNPVGPLITNLDEAPFPDRTIISLDKKGNRPMGSSYSIMISRGCPYLCTYCFNAAYNEIYKDCNSSKARRRSVQNVIAEMKTLKADVDYFSIIDDAINLLPKDYIYEFCETYKKEIGLPFSAQFRANLIDENVVGALKDAGLFCANCGIETADEEIANKILKRNITNTQIRNAFRIFNKYRIKNFSQNLIGLPVEDPVANALKTIKLNIECKVTFALFTILIPFPKTPIEQYCRENGYLDETKDFDAFSPSVYVSSILKFRNKKDNRQIDNLHKFCGIAVHYPFLLPLIKILIKFPPNRIYKYFYFFWHGYNRTVVLYTTKITPALIFSGIKQIRGYLKQHK